MIVQTVIDREGCVRSVKVLKGLHPEVDAAFEKNALAWVFQPARINDKPVDVYYNFVVSLRLH